MTREYVIGIYAERKQRILDMKKFTENKLKLENRYKFWDRFVLNRFYFDIFLMSLPFVFTVLLGMKLDGHDFEWWVVFLPLMVFELWMLLSVTLTCLLMVRPGNLEFTYSKYAHKGASYL